MAEAFMLTGKKALVTGGASGIGEKTCRELVRAGAFVYVADLNIEGAQKLAAEIGNAQALQMDVTKSASIVLAIEAVSELDILVNNAGVGSVGDIDTVEEEEFDRLMTVNVKSVYLVTKALLPVLLHSQGTIVNIASVAGLIGIKTRFAYCTSKGAVVAMTRQLAVAYPKELRVNCICPGTVETPFVEGYLQKYHAHEIESMREQLKARQPVGRLGKPEEVASLVRYLCSDEAGFVRGSAVVMDGGWTAA